MREKTCSNKGGSCPWKPVGDIRDINSKIHYTNGGAGLWPLGVPKLMKIMESPHKDPSSNSSASVLNIFLFVIYFSNIYKTWNKFITNSLYKPEYLSDNPVFKCWLYRVTKLTNHIYTHRWFQIQMHGNYRPVCCLLFVTLTQRIVIWHKRK